MDNSYPDFQMDSVEQYELVRYKEFEDHMYEDAHFPERPLEPNY